MEAHTSCKLLYCILLLALPYHAASLCGEHERQFGPDECQCQAGYSRRSGECAPCPIATFKEYAADYVEHGPACILGVQSLAEGCCSCRPNTITLATASVHSSACVCVPGYGGTACLPCQSGAYKSTISTAECTLCPEGATTLQIASTQPTHCVAMRGYHGSEHFSQCPPGSYTAAEGMLQCEQCPLGATSPAGATSQQQCECILEGFRSTSGGCTCQAGYARDATAMCVPCARGFYCPGDERQPQACPEHSSSLAGASHSGQCLCDAGHSGPDGGACVPCAAGYWKNKSGSAECSKCSEHAVSAAGSSACDCLPGHGGAECAPCAAGSFKASTGSSLCDPCPAHMSSMSGSTSFTQCSCLPHFVLSAGVCTACASNMFELNNTCLPCPPDDDLYCMCGAGGQESACSQCTFSRHERSCLPACGPGLERVQGECVSCQEGYFKSNAGAQCTQCPTVLSASRRGSVLESECTCPPNTLEVESQDMAVVNSLGEWQEDSAQHISAINALVHRGHGLWRLLVQGSVVSATVTVGERLVFQCKHTCHSTTLELAGMRGVLNASAPGALLTLLVRTRREVLLEAERAWWPAALQQAQTWAAQGALKKGFAVFRTRQLFTRTLQQCSPCPANLQCS